MADQFSRTRLLLGEGVDALQRSCVAVFGVGGVGGHVCEALGRAGVGTIHLIDNDEVSESNINRQLVATWDTIGRSKVDVMAERLLAINPRCTVVKHQCFYLPETASEFDFARFDYVVDAVDTVSAKLSLAEQAQAAGTPIISCMGAGNKLDPTAFEVTDIYKTSVCPLAKVMRRELRKRGVESLKVVYSREEALRPVFAEGEERVPGSVPFVPSVAGLIIAGEVIKDLAGYEPTC